MNQVNSRLLENFLKWCEQVKVRCRPDVAVNLIIGPPEEKQGASINFEDTDNGLSIVIWSNGEFECDYRHMDSSLDVFHYHENVSSEQFDLLALPVLSKYLAAA